MKQTKVAANLQQDFSEQEKNQARINIGAAASAALNYEILRAENAEAAAKSEVLAGTGISVTNTLAQDGHTIYTVSNSGDSLYKRLQNSIDQPYADYAFIRNLRQTPNGEVSIECSYISAATDTVTGLMSSSDKSKLDGIQNGAQVNQYAWSNLQVGNTLIQADSATDTLTVSAGNNITLTPDASNDSLTISATNTTYTAGSGLSLNGTEFSNTAPNVKSDWNAVSGSDAEILNKPTIPTVNDGTLTIQKNGTAVATFSANQSSAATANISVPTDTSDLTNGAGFITSAQVPAQVNADWDAVSGAAEILNKPTIPTVNDGTLTIQKNGTAVATFSANQSSAATANITVPTDTSDLTNGAGFITASQIPAHVNADWTASSGSAEILHKPTLATRAYGGSNVELTSLVINADDPDGYTDIMADNGSWGKLVTGPYATLLNSGVAGSVGDTNVPIYIDSNGQFAECTHMPNVEYIQFNFSNETTAQDDVYNAVVAAFTADKLPILYCGVANATLYWIPTAYGANGYSFSRTVSNYSHLVTIDASTHVITHQSKEIINYTAGTNVSISANNEISATDTKYTAGSFIDINANNVISNTMHQDTAGLMISYNTLSNAGVTTHSWGPWRLQITKKAMATWDDGTGTNPSVLVQVAHSDYISGTITNGRIQHTNYYPWKDGVMDQVYTGHVQWAFTGAYAQGGSNNGFAIDLTSPLDPDGNARACPRSMRALQLVYNCGIDSPDWIELNIEPLYVNNNTSLNTNAARLLIRAKYFYV